MDLTEVERLAALGESDTLEFKKTTGELEGACNTLCGFLNVRGGTVLIGVTDGGRVVGQDVSEQTEIKVSECLRGFEPPAPIASSIIPVGKGHRNVIAMQATPTGEYLPFTFRGRPYQRIGTVTSQMPQDRYRQLLLERAHALQRWENAPTPGISVSDLDQEEIQTTLQVGRTSGRLLDAATDSPADVLDRLGLRADGQILNAAVVLFGREFLPSYPQCQLRMARFVGKEKTEFLDNRQIHGNGFDLLEEAISFLQRHLPVAGRIQPGLLERLDEPLFPFEALREALVNAICHRDYSRAGGAVSLAIYDDRLEIWSDGTLPFGLTVEDLRRDHTSRPRNPLIAETFYRRGLVERWGRGTQKIIELCVRAGQPEPEFLEQGGAVGVRFLPSGYVPPLRVGHRLTDRQREILRLLADTRTLAFREIRSHWEAPPPDRTLREDLLHLKRLGLLTSVGHGRGAVWLLIGDANDHE